MRRILAALALALGVAAPAQAQFFNPPLFFPQPASSYVGPGDVVSGATAWYGLRAYDAAYAASGGAAFDWACTNGGSHSGTVHVAAAGGLSAGDLATMASACAANTVTVSKLYDQTGNGYHLTQGTGSAQPIYAASCLGSLPCLQGDGARTITNASFALIAQPYTWSFIADWTGNFSAQQGIFAFAAGDAGVYFNNGATNIAVYYGSSATSIAISDNTTYAYQAVAEGGGSSLFYVNGTSNAGSPGTNGSDTDITLFSFSGPSNYMTGNIAEAGIWPSAFNSTQAAAMNSNQRSYWGF